MIPPPSSFAPPPSGQNMQFNNNKLTQQMQNMKLGPPGPQNVGGIPGLNKTSNPQMIAGSQLPGQQLPHPDAQQFPSPQHKSQMSTTVTYSSQPRATYPYMNNNTPGNMSPGMQKSPTNNNQYCSNTPMSAPSAVQQQPNVNQNLEQKFGNIQMASPIQTYSTSFNQTNGISNGHEDLSKQNKNPSFQLNQAYSSPQQPIHSMTQPPPSSSQGQMQFQQPVPAPSTFQPPPVPSNNPNLPMLGQQHSAIPSSSPMYSPVNNQALPPPQSGGQSYSQPPPIGFNSQMNSSSSPPGSLPPNLPPFSGVPNKQPNSGNMWPPQSSSYPPQSPGYPPQSPGYPPQSPSYPPQSPGYMYGPQNQAPQQQPKMPDLDQMPSAVQVRKEDRKIRGGYYQTDLKGQPPPLVTTDFIVQERGICSPRFIRSSVYCLPNQPDILKQTGIPFAITVSPLANLNEGESEPPLALYREQGPLRCKRCKAYICPFMTFMEGGRCFQCAFCKVVTEVPQDYFCFLDGMGERTDKYHRPELCLGSYEYIATKEYCRNDELPNPPAYIFMIEVSNATFRNGLVPLLCENLKSILQCLQSDESIDSSKLRVGFVTYNSVLHFYNMKKNLTQPHIMVLSDVHNAFVPLLEGFLVTLSEAEALVDCLMEHIPRLFINEPATEIILGPVIQVGLEALKNANCSGKLLVFHSTIPNADAPGKLPHREGQKLLGTDKQKVPLSPQNDFYSKLAQECVAAGCAVDLFLFPNAYVDIASLNPLCKHTGGQLYKYTYFQSHIDGDRFLEDLERNITTKTAFDAVLRVRTSAGISPVFYFGNFYMSNATDIELSAIDCHKAITVELAYDDKLPENEIVNIQAALLYTSITGERRIRVHNLAILTSVGMADVYKSCELDTVINLIAKQALKQVYEVSPQQIKNNIIGRSVKVLSCYRKNCASSSAAGQLLLPDPLKLLPLYVNCLLKSDAIAGGTDMSLDDRSFAMLAVNSMDVKSTSIYFYPHLIPLHEVNPDSDEIPSPVRCSIEKLNDSGAYLLENGIYMFLWIGQAISPDWLQNVLGVQSTNQIDKQKTSLPELNTPLSKKVRRIIEDLEEDQQWYMRLTVMVQGDKLEVVFRQFLVEDRGADSSPSYVDFLCHLHKEIMKNL